MEKFEVLAVVAEKFSRTDNLSALAVAIAKAVGNYEEPRGWLEKLFSWWERFSCAVPAEIVYVTDREFITCELVPTGWEVMPAPRGAEEFRVKLVRQPGATAAVLGRSDHSYCLALAAAALRAHSVEEHEF